MHKRKIVVIMGNFMFPDGNAAGKRVLGLGHIFRDLGYEVEFIGLKSEENTNIENNSHGYVSHIIPKNNNKLSWLKVNQVATFCTSVCEEIGVNNIALLITYGSPVLSLWVSTIIRWAHKRHIKILCDCVDWIEKSGFSKIYDVIKYLDTNYQKRIAACQADGIIAISTFLERFYLQKGKPVILVPPVGVPVTVNKKPPEGPVVLVYAGYPFSPLKKLIPNDFKDRIDLIISLVVLLSEQCKVELKIFGIEKQQYLFNMASDKEMLDNYPNIFFMGKQNDQVVKNAIQNADFTILIRDATKMTTAGFPTKISESLLLGTPVITNITGDIGEYVKDGQNGIIISNDIKKAKRKLIKQIGSRAQLSVEGPGGINPFDYRRYTDLMKEFLSSLG